MYTLELEEDEMRLLTGVISTELELWPGGDRLTEDEDEAMWRLISKIEKLKVQGNL